MRSHVSAEDAEAGGGPRTRRRPRTPPRDTPLARDVLPAASRAHRPASARSATSHTGDEPHGRYRPAGARSATSHTGDKPHGRRATRVTLLRQRVLGDKPHGRHRQPRTGHGTSPDGRVTDDPASVTPSYRPRRRRSPPAAGGRLRAPRTRYKDEAGVTPRHVNQALTSGHLARLSPVGTPGGHRVTEPRLTEREGPWETPGPGPRKPPSPPTPPVPRSQPGAAWAAQDPAGPGADCGCDAPRTSGAEPVPSRQLADF